MTDSFFGAAWTDIDEWRDAPVRHRYVHGGFEGTDTRFSFYFPPAEQWQGGSSRRSRAATAATSTPHERRRARWAASRSRLASGAYLVESNQGHIGSDLSIMFSEPTVHALPRERAVSAVLAASSRPRCTGTRRITATSTAAAAVRRASILCLENCPESGRAQCRSSRATRRRGRSGSRCRRTRRACSAPKIASVIDAVEPGGSGDPFAGLTAPQREALAAMYRAGFPRGRGVVVRHVGLRGHLRVAHRRAGVVRSHLHRRLLVGARLRGRRRRARHQPDRGQDDGRHAARERHRARSARAQNRRRWPRRAVRGRGRRHAGRCRARRHRPDGDDRRRAPAHDRRGGGSQAVLHRHRRRRAPRRGRHHRAVRSRWHRATRS